MKNFMVVLLAMMLASGIASAVYVGQIIQVNNTGPVANFSWQAGSASNTYLGSWNFSSFFDNQSVAGGSVSLRLTSNANCTSSQTQWNFTGGGLNNATNKTFTLTCGVAYATQNYNYSIIVNASGVLGGNASNASWVGSATVNVSVVNPTYTISNRAQSSQVASDCVVAAMPITVSSVASQATQVGVRCANTNDEDCTVAIRDWAATTCFAYITSNGAFTCYTIGAQTSASISVPVEICTQGDGSVTLYGIIGDVSSIRNETLTQTITIDHKNSKAVAAATSAGQLSIGGIIISAPKNLQPIHFAIGAGVIILALCVLYAVSSPRRKRR